MIKNILIIIIVLMLQLLVSYVVYADSNNYIQMENDILLLKLNKTTLEFSILDKRNNHTWIQKETFNEFDLINYKKTNNLLNLSAKLKKTNFVYNILIKLDSKNELVIEVDDKNSNKTIVYPYPFIGNNMDLILPLNEGIMWSSNDKIIESTDFPLFSGYYISMPFFASIKDSNGYLAIVETPDDSYISVENSEKKSYIYTKWFKRKTQNPSKRKIRFIFLNNTNISKIALKYKNYLEQTSEIKPFKDKTNNKYMEKILSSAHIWSFSNNDERIVQKLLHNEIDNLIWNNTKFGVSKTLLKKFKYIMAEYKNFNDTINPKTIIKSNEYLKEINSNMWYKKIILQDGNWKKGSHIEIEDENSNIELGQICDKFLPEYINKQNLNNQYDNLYSMYIDNLVSVELNECFDNNHQITRNDSKNFRIETLKNLYNTNSIIGLESGIYYGANYSHYNTGMMSISPFIKENPFNKITEITNVVPKNYGKINGGFKYRIPLWELVYSRGIGSTWYPSDGNNSIPDYWETKDLLNILYGTSPLYVIDDSIWNASKTKIIDSITKVCTAIKNNAGSEMTNFEYLKEDKSVQKTTFSNGYYVIVNFGSKDYILNSKYKVKPMSFYEKKLDLNQVEKKTVQNKNFFNFKLSYLLIFGGTIIVLSFFFIFLLRK